MNSHDFTNLEAIVKILKKPPKKRTTNDIKTLSSSLEHIDFFQKLVSQNGPASLLKISSYLQYEFCQKGNYLFIQGSQGTRFYIILNGLVGVMIPTFNAINKINTPLRPKGNFIMPSRSKSHAFSFKEETAHLEKKMKEDLIEVKELKSGESFGELALISNKLRSFSILCKEDCHFAYLEKDGFETVLKELAEKRLLEGLLVLRQFRIFANMRQTNLLSFLYGFQNKKLKKGQSIYRENENADAIFLIKEGEFLICKEIIKKSLNNQNILIKTNMKLAILQKGDILGDEDFNKENKTKFREFSAICESTQGELLEMKMEKFIKFIRRDNLLLYESLLSESQDKISRFHQRMLENCNLMKSQENLIFNKFKGSHKKLKELFSSSNFHLIKGEMNSFHKKQEKLKNCQKLKTLRKMKILNEVEEMIDQFDESKSFLYKSSLVEEFKQRMENIEKNSAFSFDKGRSFSIDFTSNPLILKNIGVFSPKYSRIMDIITHNKDLKKR